ncbi:MAG: reverse gyrase [Thermoprotei archaeon]|nr:reverse gyrase [Thermoprotei archaeon]
MGYERVGRGLYKGSCPNCGGTITENRLSLGLPCEECLPVVSKKSLEPETIYKALIEAGKLKAFKEIYELDSKARKLIGFFEEALGSQPWGAQRTWIRRLVRGDSFSITAPTGVGKTTFGIIASLYYACTEGSKSFIIVPTTTLVAQAVEKASAMASKTGCNTRIVGVHAKMPAKSRAKALEAVASGDFDVLISTMAFARKHVDKLSGYRFKLVFVDDVDAVLKSGRSVDVVLKIVGFTSEDIEDASALSRVEVEIARRAGEEQDKSLLEKLRQEAEGLRRKLQDSKSKASILIVSSATGKPRGPKVKLFRVLLRFEAGGRGDIGLRNIVDTYVTPSDSIEEEAARIISRLGSGTLAYVPLDWGIEGAERVAEFLRNRGVNAEAYHSKTPFSVLKKFIEGKIGVLVGVANYYGALVRGIDLPERVKYAVFLGVPRHRFSAEIGEPHPAMMLRVLAVLANIDIEDVAVQARRYLGELRRIVRRLSPAYMQVLAERVLEGDVKSGGRALRVLAEAYKFLRSALSDEEVWRKLSERSDVGIVFHNGSKYLLVADIATYIQASGRTSRLYAGGITKGLSVVIVDNLNVFNGLKSKSKIIADITWRDFNTLDLDSLKKEIEKDRRKVSRVLKGKVKGKDIVKTALLIVESPNKARTIASFFGQPGVRYMPGGLRVYEVALQDYILMVAASGGHVFDLVPRAGEIRYFSSGHSVLEDVFGVLALEGPDGRVFAPVYSSIKRCLDCGHQFTEDVDKCPRCGSLRVRDSRSIIEDLRRLAWESDIVFIGTDPDTEGEKIGWDVAVLIKPHNRNIRRLEFHEVTRDAILAALRNHREFQERLVEAQIVRRIEDRWIGFTLSPLLWCDFWPRYCEEIRQKANILGKVKPRDLEVCRERDYYFNLSAGRVQTPVLGWIVDRSEEYKEKVKAYVLTGDGKIIARIREDEVGLDSRDLIKILDECARMKLKGKKCLLEVKVGIEKEEWTPLHPPPPYTTDTMIRDASRFLKLGASETMRLAQDLFEWGLITYHRTDSTRVSEKGMAIASDWLEDKYGGLGAKLYRARRWGEGGAHEAIRPVKPIDATTLQLLVEEGAIELPGRLTRDHLRLYDIIFKRFIASQMVEAEALKVTYVLDVSGYRLSRSRIVKFGRDGNMLSKGFTLVWDYVREEEALKEGWIKEVEVKRFKVGRRQPYTQGDVVEEMKARGIGRPSTYAKIIDTLIKRGYVRTLMKGKAKGYVVATLRGKRVYEYLSKELKEVPDENLSRVPSLVSEERTRTLERLMDEVEAGSKGWLDVLGEVYGEIGGLSLPIRLSLGYTIKGDTGGLKFNKCLEKAREVFMGEV